MKTLSEIIRIRAQVVNRGCVKRGLTDEKIDWIDLGYIMHTHGIKYTQPDNFSSIEFGPFCNICGKELDLWGRFGFIVDHIIPVSWGGQNITKNLQLLCFECHIKKSVEERKISV